MPRPSLARPKHYSPEPGDEFVQIGQIGPQHVGRIFEARNQLDGSGILGPLADAIHYMLQGTVQIRFEGEQLALFDVPEARILLKAEGFVMPTPEEVPADE